MHPTTQLIINASAHKLPLPDKLFHCSITSPPYYSLRKYQGEQAVDWPEVRYSPLPGLDPLTIPAMTAPLGLEPTPEAFVGHLVLIYREVRRVLRDDGVAWLNLGDSYARQAGDDATRRMPNTGQSRVFLAGLGREGLGNNRPPASLNPGDLMLLPHRVALALQADGWTIRNDCVWSKASPMPESVAGWRWERCGVKVAKRPTGQTKAVQTGVLPGRDSAGSMHKATGRLDDPAGLARYESCPGCARCEATGGYVLRRGSWRHTRAHEYIFQLTKGMGYYCNQERVREPSTGQNGKAADLRRETKDHLLPGQNAIQHREDRESRSDNGRRNPRTVLTPGGSAGYPGAHYAVYPPNLIAPLIRASCPVRSCPVCGAAWAPMVEREGVDPIDYNGKWLDTDRQSSGRRMLANMRARRMAGNNHDNPFPCGNILGYRPTCTCPDHEPAPGWCLDPFTGSGTTLEVCHELGVNAVGVDLAPTYLDEHVKPRLGLTPVDALDELPLFAGL